MKWYLYIVCYKKTIPATSQQQGLFQATIFSLYSAHSKPQLLSLGSHTPTGIQAVCFVVIRQDLLQLQPEYRW